MQNQVLSLLDIKSYFNEKSDNIVKFNSETKKLAKKF